MNEVQSPGSWLGGIEMVETTAPAGRKRVVKPAEERQREILDAALELFSTKGFDETTVQDIAGAAGVAIGTVYLYFPSKEHVLLGLHEEFHRGTHRRFAGVFEDIARRRESGEEVGHEDVIDAVLEAEVAHARENKKVIEVMTRYIPRSELAQEALASDRRFVQAMADSFQKGIDKGGMHASDPEMVAYLLDAAVSGTVRNSIVYGDPPDLDRLLAQAKELFHKALAPVPREKA